MAAGLAYCRYMKQFQPFLLAAVLASGLWAADREDGSFEKTLSVSGAVELDLKTDSGGIRVHTGNSGTVHVHAILRAQHGFFQSNGDVMERIRALEAHPPIDQIGNRVRVGYALGRDALRGVSMELDVETPPDSRVRAEADSGGVQVDGVHGPVECKTDSGGIGIHDVSSDVRAEVDSGGIHIENVGGSLFARADSGGIDAKSIGGSIDAQTDSGSVRVSQTKPAPITAKADSGGVTVSLVPGAGYDLRADVSSGRISTPSVMVMGTISQHHIEGKVGNGGPLVKVHADSGSVTID